MGEEENSKKDDYDLAAANDLVFTTAALAAERLSAAFWRGEAGRHRVPRRRVLLAVTNPAACALRNASTTAAAVAAGTPPAVAAARWPAAAAAAASAASTPTVVAPPQPTGTRRRHQGRCCKANRRWCRVRPRMAGRGGRRRRHGGWPAARPPRTTCDVEAADTA